MPCDPRKIFTDLDVIGVTLTYANIWVAGTQKTLSTDNMNTDLNIFTFRYKSEDFYNVFRYSLNILQSAEIRRGLYDGNGTENDRPLIELISYV